MATAYGKPLKRVIDPTLAKAFTHPLRGHVWVTICEKGIASPKEIAEEIGLDVSEVSYHFRELKRRRLIKLVRTEQRRGFPEHFYEPASPIFYFDDFDWMEIPQEIRASFSGDVFRQIVEEAVAALVSGSFDARNRHLSRTWLLVDEEGWEELTGLLEEALERVLAIRALCAKRLRRSGESGIPVSVAMTGFETAGGAAARGEDEPGLGP